MKRKIFNLSFNKCGTTTMHRFFQKNGINSRSHGSNNLDRNLAWRLYRNFCFDLDPLTGISEFEAFHDITYASDVIVLEASKLYQYIHQSYPDSYYLFVSRPVDDWIRSRRKHLNLLKRHKSYLKLDDDEAVIAIWRDSFIKTERAFHDYFLANGSRYLNFRLGEHSPDLLRVFLSDDYQLDLGHWGWENETRRT